MNRCAFSVVIVLALQGCQSPIRDQAQVDSIVSGRPNQEAVASYPRCSVSQWIERASSGLGCGGNTKLENNLKEIGVGTSTVNPVVLRNSAQAELMTFSDLECKYHQAGIYGTQSLINVFSSLGSLALSAASVVSDRGMGASGRGARNLAAGSTFLGGARGAINSDVYFSYIAPAVLSEIDLVRKQERAKILAKQSCTVLQYPPARAINDALNYHEHCSFVSGLSSLLKKAGVEQRDGDVAQSARAAGVAKRVAEATKRLEDANAAKKILTSAPANPPTPAQLAEADKAITAATEDLRRWQDLQAFVGLENPVVLRYAPNSIAKARQDLAVKQLELDNLPAGDPAIPAATIARDQAKKILQALEGADGEPAVDPCLN